MVFGFIVRHAGKLCTLGGIVAGWYGYVNQDRDLMLYGSVLTGFGMLYNYHQREIDSIKNPDNLPNPEDFDSIHDRIDKIARAHNKTVDAIEAITRKTDSRLSILEEKVGTKKTPKVINVE